MTDKIWLGEQERTYSCGAASLKYALCVLGFSPREGDLRKLARTTWRGTPTKSLVAAAKRFGVSAKVRHFLDDEWESARAWLHAELTAGHPVILDVDGFEHYVAAVQLLDKRVMILDPEGGPMDGSAYARLVLPGDARLKRWWLSGDEEGEPDAFRGTSLSLPDGAVTDGPRLRFDDRTVHRYVHGRPWILDEYLVDCVEIAKASSSWPGEPRPLEDVVRDVRGWIVDRVTHWHGASPGEISMCRAHLEDIAIAAHAMGLSVPSSSTPVVAADVAAILTTMLHADD